MILGFEFLGIHDFALQSDSSGAYLTYPLTDQGPAKFLGPSHFGPISIFDCLMTLKTFRTITPSPTSNSQSNVTTNSQLVSWQVCLCVWHPFWVHYQICITVRQLSVWFGVPSLMRGWVCSLQLLLVLTSAVILGSQFCKAHDHIVLSQIWDPPTW
jgi:hypothetical protein